MKKACGYCGGIHEAGFDCPKKPRSCNGKKRYSSGGSREDIFRSTYEWKKKRSSIMARDGYMCAACRAGLKGTVRTVEPYDLSVHHIVPLREDISLRLSDGNLVTLCRRHHEAAEAGEIAAEELLNIIKNIPPEG